MSDDKALIDRLGGPAKVADLLGFGKAGGTQRVHNWSVRGIPARIKLARPDLFQVGAAGLVDQIPAAPADVQSADRRHDGPEAPASREAADPQLWPAKAEQRVGGDRRLQPRDGEGVRDGLNGLVCGI